MKENLSFKNIFKRETKLASYIIICLTIVVLSLSYAMFFRVNGNSENQVVEAGDLVFTYENSSQTITNTNSNECFMPMSGEETSLYLGTCDYKLSVQNTGSLKGAYTLRLIANEDNTIDASYLKVVLRKQVGETLEIVEGYENGKLVSELTEGILIQDEEMETGSTVVYSIFLYLDESIITSLEESQINTIINGTISYQIEGTGLVHEGQGLDTVPKYKETLLNARINGDNDFTSFVHKYLTSIDMNTFDKYYSEQDDKVNRDTKRQTYKQLADRVIGHDDMYKVSTMVSVNDKLLNTLNKHNFIGEHGNDTFMNSSLLGTLKRIDAVETFTFVILLITKYMSYYNIDTDEDVSYSGQIGPNPLGYNIAV